MKNLIPLLLIATLTGCATPGTPTTQPALPNAAAQSELTTIENLESGAMLVMQFAAAADPALAPDYALAVIADDVFQKVAGSEQDAITSGQPLTAQQVQGDMAAVLADVLKIRAAASAKSAAKAKTAKPALFAPTGVEWLKV